MFTNRLISRLFSVLFIIVLILAQVTPAYAAGLVVNSLLDNTTVDGNCTLREAIRNANDNAATYGDCTAGSGADTITFSVSGAITLGSTLPDITDASGLTLDGTAQMLTISGNHAVRTMKVNAGASLTLDNLTIANGKITGNSGGGIYNGGTLAITDSTFSGNAGDYGGGIDSNAGTLTITNCAFSGNSAIGYGGGVYITGGTLTITNSTFSNNSSTGGSGGGVYNNAGTLTIANSAFSGNTAPGWGGSGGGIFTSGGTLTITNSFFSGNSASNFGSGGGIANDGTLIITNSFFSGNSATTGGSIYTSGSALAITNSTFSNNGSRYGGGIYNSGGTLTITNSTFSGNSANYGGSGSGGRGGGIYTDGGMITNSTFSGNSAYYYGGAIYNSSGILTIMNSTFSGNSAAFNGGGGSGIYNNGTGTTLRNTIVANSTSGGNCGGTITNSGNNIDDATTCGWGSASGSMSNTNPNLGPLTDNGGPTQTVALFTGSPAIDAGDDATCAAAPVSGLDQRGVVRPQGAHCDIGSFEYEPDAISPTVVSVTRANADPTSAKSVNFTVTFSENVTGVNTTDFSLTSPGVIGASVTSVTPVSGTTYTVKVNTGTGNGTIRLDVTDDDSIVDRVGNPLGGWGGGNGNFTTGEAYTTNKILTFNSTATQDGWILESTETSGVGGTRNAAATTFNLGDDAQDKQYRALLHFDTSSLADNAVITKVTLKIRKQGVVGTNPFTVLGVLRVDMQKPFFGTTGGLEIGDFQAAVGKSTVATFGVTPLSNWYSALLNGPGRAYVNKTGSTQFRLRFPADDNNNNLADFMKFFSGNAGVATRPQLIIEYYVP